MAPTCEYCGTEERVQFCTVCIEHFCDDHWNSRRAHRENKLGPKSMPHEKVSPEIVDMIEHCMAEPENDSDQQKQHQEDDDTTWFGLDRDISGEPVLAEYRRYAAIMMESQKGQAQTRFPALVSFIGQTGAGKSSLIRLLIDPSSSPEPNSSSTVAAPIVGRSNSSVPTSADVHLYADPATSSTDSPILFADCEGFQGGERDPVAVNAVPTEPVKASGTFSQGQTKPGISAGAFRRLARGTKRKLLWAVRDSPEHEKTSKRGYAVSQMYPRIFYAFSDVVVFVLDNSRILEDVVENLLEWAAANYARSTNLPNKPHAVIALNKSPNTTPEDQWATLNATANLLRSKDAQIHKNSTFEKYAAKWRANDFHIQNMEELLTRYYSSVHVVRLPDKSRVGLMNQQQKALYSKITECCQASRDTKSSRHMLPDVDEFGLYLTLAFDHFSESLEVPFDYVKASLKHKPPPATLSDNMREFVLMVAEHRGLQGRQVKVLFDELTPMVASCLMLDSARKQRIGKSKDWFKDQLPETPDRATEQKLEDGHPLKREHSYDEACRSVVSWYVDWFVPCEFEIPDNIRLSKMHECIQTRGAHERLHRGNGLFGSIDYFGDFKTSFHERSYAWEKKILDYMQSLEAYSWHDHDNPRQARGQAHARTLQRFYEQLPTTKFFSNSICLSCLSGPPEHELDCGHLLCSECAREFGRFDEKKRIILDHCPLHRDTKEATGSPKAVVPTDPAYSGLRVLVLDGGGIRGIAELCILQALRNRIGFDLQNFFDLVVGTSTGGIIALAFGDQMWPVEKCTQQFEDLVSLAFTPRKLQNFQVIRHVQMFLKKSKYETKPLQASLQRSFTETMPLFGRRRRRPGRRLKVAVTATSSTGSKAYVLSNYNTENNPYTTKRPSGGELRYIRYRPSQRQDEIRVWEAARSTSAAPGYFKPFIKKGSENIFEPLVDGGILHNNPVEIALEETRRIARIASQMPDPDVLVSVGTGWQEDIPYYDPVTNPKSMRERYNEKTWLNNLFTLIRYQVKLNVDAERRWNQVLGRNEVLKPRMRRLNPDLGEPPPEMDKVSQVKPLRNNVLGWLSGPGPKHMVDEIACALVASSFYFERIGNASIGQGASIQLPGLIKCRLTDNKESIKGIGRMLSSAYSDVRVIVENTPGGQVGRPISLPISSMKETGLYENIHITVIVQGEETETGIVLFIPGLCAGRQRFPLSGFPRILMKHDFASREA